MAFLFTGCNTLSVEEWVDEVVEDINGQIPDNTFLPVESVSEEKYVYGQLTEEEQLVYDAVLAVIQAQVAMALDMERALKQLNDVSWERRELERISSGITRQEEVIAHNNQMKAMIYEDFKNEIISLEDYRIFKAEFDKNISEAKETIARLVGNRNQVKNGLTGQQSWLSQFHQYKNIQALTRRVVVYFIERVEITAEKEVVVTLSHSDQFQAIAEFLGDYHIASKEVG